VLKLATVIEADLPAAFHAGWDRIDGVQITFPADQLHDLVAVLEDQRPRRAARSDAAGLLRS
jgi:hypothetical protein